MSRTSAPKLKVLRQYLQKLRGYAREVKWLPCKPDNFWAFMVLAFLNRYERHVNSVEKLLDDEDVWLVLRTMIEGMLLLKWAAKIPLERNDRAKKYQQYFWAEAHRRIRIQEATGRSDNPDIERIKNTTREQLGNVAVTVLKPGQSNDFFIDDKFDANEAVREITGLSITQLFEDSGSKEVHERNYNLFSAYHHWNPLTLAAYQDSEGRIRVSQPIEGHEVEAIAATVALYSELLGYAYEIFRPERLGNIQTIQRGLVALMASKHVDKPNLPGADETGV